MSGETEREEFRVIMDRQRRTLTFIILLQRGPLNADSGVVPTWARRDLAYLFLCALMSERL